MEININADDVERLVKDAILKAGIGKTIEKAIQNAFTGYDNPIDKGLKSYVSIVISELLATEYKDKIAEAVRAALDAKVTAAVLQEISDKTIDKIVRSAEDRYS